jgi:Mg2+-importing ATPase
LTSDQAARRLRTVGPNVLASHRVTAFGVLVHQLRNPLLVLLLAAAGVSVATGGTTEGVIIAAIVLLSVGLGFINEYRSEVAVAALHANIRHQALVWRDGRQQRLDVRELVPGDVVALQVGDLVPADLRLLEADQLECDEAVLTGEAIRRSRRRPPPRPATRWSTLARARSWAPSSTRAPGARSWWLPAHRPRSARSPSGSVNASPRPPSRPGCGTSPSCWWGSPRC